MATKHTNIFHFNSLKNLPKSIYLVCKYTIWQPCCLASDAQFSEFSAVKVFCETRASALKVNARRSGAPIFFVYLLSSPDAVSELCGNPASGAGIREPASLHGPRAGRGLQCHGSPGGAEIDVFGVDFLRKKYGEKMLVSFFF
jgi:hypothetical protein